MGSVGDAIGKGTQAILAPVTGIADEVFGGLTGSKKTQATLQGAKVAAPTVDRSTVREVGAPSFTADQGFGAALASRPSISRAPSIPTTANIAQVQAPTIQQQQAMFGRDVAVVRPTGAFGGATLSTQDQAQARAQQVALAQQLQAQAAGTAPSLAEAQLRAESDRTLAQQLAAAQSQRGGNQAALQRTLARSQAEQGQQLAQSAAQARLAEQLQAQQALGQLSGQIRGQDIGLAQAQAQLQQEAGLTAAEQALRREQQQAQLVQETIGREAQAADVRSLQQAQLQQQAGLQNQQIALELARLQQQGAIEQGRLGLSQEELNLQREQQKNQLALALQQQGLSADIANQQADLQMQQLAVTGQLGVQGLNVQLAQEQAKQQGALTGGLLSAGGALLAASDKRLKKNIKEGSKSTREFLDKLKSHEYEYKDEKFGEGRKLGVMAQDVEKSKMGKSMVRDTEEGKMLDMASGFGAILAAQADLHKRLSEIENKKKKKKRG